MRIRLAVYVACIGEMRSAYNILVREPEGKRPLGRSRHGGMMIFKLILKKIRWCEPNSFGAGY
jgi:hypothetical protein